ncbi:MAG: flagellar filament capping protein FliD [Bdellovibrio sp.]|nr:flagellar filament capping protein FliD [Bdellovibrio sp.]
MAISFGSINTGLPKDIVNQLIEAERIPIQQMEVRKGKIVDKRKILGDLIGLVQKVRDEVQKTQGAKNLRELKVETNNTYIGIDLDKNIAKPGSNQIEVIELAQKSTALSSGFPDRNESYVGVGYIEYETPSGESREVYIDPENSTLDGIARVINSDESSGLSATVINDGSGSDKPFRLALSVNGTGAGNKAKFPYFYFIDGDYDLYLEHERPAANAKIKFNGFEIEYPTNKIDDLIPGVVIDLKKAKPGEEFGINITEDVQAVALKISNFIESLNAVLSFIKQQNALDQTSDTSRTLGGDSVLQSLESRIRSLLFEDVVTSQGYRRVGDLGVTFQRTGLLKVDNKKFENFLAKDYALVTEILVGYFDAETKTKNPGFIDNAQKVVDSVLRTPDGLLQSRSKTFQSNIDQIDRRIAQKNRFIEQKEKNLKEKFSRLETTISKIKNQGAGLAAMNNQINPVTQLG